jgi:EpsI family protein
MPKPVTVRTASIALCAVLAVQAAAFYTADRTERTIAASTLAAFPVSVDSWMRAQDFPIDPEVQKVLKADETLNRSYVGPGYAYPLNFFVAFFKTQRTGVAPHSPKNCLPGAGWTPSSSGTLDIPLDSNQGSISVNRYVVARGDEKTLVMYWYQTPYRTVASEYEAKVWLVLDTLRYRRSDTSLVRVVVPVVNGDEAKAEKAATDFIRGMYPRLQLVLPAA